LAILDGLLVVGEEVINLGIQPGLLVLVVVGTELIIIIL
jgi:hypothetical protein